MYDCELWETAEKQVTLKYVEEEDVDNITEINRCLKALKELESIVQPFSVELMLICQNRQNLSYSFKIEPPHRVGQLEIDSVPVEIYVHRSAEAEITKVANISTKIIVDWVHRLLQQKCPNPLYELRWAGINIRASRAKVTNKANLVGRESFRVKSAAGKLEYPLLECNNNIWIGGPKKPYLSYPPIKILFNTDTGAHKMTIYTAWSMWYDIDSFGYKELYQAIERIVSQGWRLSEKTPLKKPKYVA